MSAASLDSHETQSRFCIDAMADERAAKRARIDMKAFNEVDLAQFSLQDKGKGKSGHLTFPLIGGEVIRFNLTPSGWLLAPFGFDLSGKYEKPSFLGGDAPEKSGTPEGLNLRFTIQGDEAVFVGELDKVAETAFAAFAPAKWNPLVVPGSLFSTPMCKVAVILKGDDLTKIAVVVDGEVKRGEGWSFLEPYISSCNNFRRAEIKLTVKVKKLWNVAGKAGLGLQATQLVLRATEKPTETDAFADDSELLA